MKTTISSRGQIVLPSELRERDTIDVGDVFDIERLDEADYRLVRRKPRPHRGHVDWLLTCPEQGCYTPVESESTDTL